MLACGADVVIVILVYRIIPCIELYALSKYSLSALQIVFNIRLWCPPAILADARWIHQLQVAKSPKMPL